MASSRLTRILQSLDPALMFKIHIHTLFAFLACFSATCPAYAQTPDCPATLGELQHKIDDLEKEKDTVNSFLKKDAFDILDSSYKGLSNAMDAGPGALLLKSKEFDEIQKTLSEAEIAATNADRAWQRAQNALRLNQRDLAITRMLQAAGAGAEAKSKFKHAFDQTADVFKRAPGFLTGEVDPFELAKRFWESHQDVADAFNELSRAGQAMGNHDVLVVLIGSLNRRIAELRSQQPSAPYSRSVPCSSSNKKKSDPSSEDACDQYRRDCASMPQGGIMWYSAGCDQIGTCNRKK